MLGEVGGLYDFFYAGLSFLTVLFSQRLSTISQVTSLFQISSPNKVGDSRGSCKFEPLQLSTCDKVLYNLTIGCLPRGRKRKALRRGAKIIERHLDLVTLIKQARAS